MGAHLRGDAGYVRRSGWGAGLCRCSGPGEPAGALGDCRGEEPSKGQPGRLHSTHEGAGKNFIFQGNKNQPSGDQELVLQY